MEFGAVAEGVEADGHVLGSEAGLRLVGAEVAVPPRQVEAEHPVDSRRRALVAVVEHRDAVQQHLKHEHGHGRWADRHDGGKLREHRQDDLDGMEAGTGGRVEVEVGAAHAVQPPQRGHGVEHHVLEIDDEVEDDDRDRDLQRERKRDQVEDAPAVIGGGCRRQRWVSR